MELIVGRCRDGPRATQTSANRENLSRFFYGNPILRVQRIEQPRLARVAKLVAIGTSARIRSSHRSSRRISWRVGSAAARATLPRTRRSHLRGTFVLVLFREDDLNSIFLLPVTLYGPGDNLDPRTSHVIPALTNHRASPVAAGIRAGTGGM